MRDEESADQPCKQNVITGEENWKALNKINNYCEHVWHKVFTIYFYRIMNSDIRR